MLELLAYLRANGFKTFIVSGGGIDFMRPCRRRGLWRSASSKSYGSSGKFNLRCATANPAMKLPRSHFIDTRLASPSASRCTSAFVPIALSATPTAICKMLEWAERRGRVRFA